MIDEILRGKHFCSLDKIPKEPMIVKFGVDPTSPHIHLGHSVVLRKLRQFQDLGHKAVLIIGDFTASIGDPTGKNKTRPRLDPDKIKENADTYLKQVGKILDMDKLTIHHNSEWFDSFSLRDFIELSSNFTAAQILNRDDFSKRMEENQPVFIHEMTYPMLQAWDSVQIKADIEIGGSDQTFNLWAGHDLMKSMRMKPQEIFTMPILTGTDGVNKMSKSLGNSISMEDNPIDVFGKTMSIPDANMEEWFNLLTDFHWVRDAKEFINKDPRKAKETLAMLITMKVHGKPAGIKAKEHFDKTIVNKEVPENIREITSDDHRIIAILRTAGFAKSNADARRLIQQKAVKVNGNVVGEDFVLGPGENIIQKGKIHWVKINV